MGSLARRGRKGFRDPGSRLAPCGLSLYCAAPHSPMTMLRSALPLLMVLFASCGTHFEYAELRVGDVPFARVWEGLDYVCRTDGFRVDSAASDRGLGIYETRWRERTLALGHAGRRRLHAEINDDHQVENGLMVRFYVEQQRVHELTRALRFVEDDWADAGQDTGYQRIFGERLRHRLGLVAPPTGVPQTRRQGGGS